MGDDRTRTGIIGRIGRVRPHLDGDYWFDRGTWSAYITYTLLVGLAAVIALPTSRRISEIEAVPIEASGIFPIFFVVLYGILAITLGQAEPAWRERASVDAQHVHLFVRELFALALALPYWLVYVMADARGPLILLGILLQLWLFGAVLGLFGWRLALTHTSEIFQFNTKYLVYFGSLLVTGLVPAFGALSPFNALDRMLAGSVWPVVQGDLVWLAAGAVLAWSIRRADGQELS